MKQVYADYAAATPTDPRVIERMNEVALESIGNPSSRHSFGRRSDEELTRARQVVANFLNAQPSEIYFTGSGTESNNLALLGLARANKSRGNHIITSAIEHPSVKNTCQTLERDGFEVTYLPVTKDGIVAVEELKAAIRPTTILVSIHLANSEIGVVQNINELAGAAHAANAVFHTDACQAVTFLPLDVHMLAVDALTFNGTKLYGPKGVAVLFVRDGISIFPIMFGGGQEQALRSGTENLPAIAGLAQACDIAAERRTADAKNIASLRDELEVKLQEIGATINCNNSQRLPNHLSVVLRTNKTDVVAELDRRGIAISSGSACSSRTQTDSHVLQAIGLTSEQINKTVRITLGRESTQADIQRIVAAISELA